MEAEVIDLLARRHYDLRNNYRINPLFLYDCNLLALEVGELFLHNDCQPSILRFERRLEVPIQLKTNADDMLPVRYNGKIVWHAHAVCENEGQVYDPLIGEPVGLGDYSRIAFAEKICHSVHRSSKEIELNLMSPSVRRRLNNF